MSYYAVSYFAVSYVTCCAPCHNLYMTCHVKLIATQFTSDDSPDDRCVKQTNMFSLIWWQLLSLCQVLNDNAIRRMFLGSLFRLRCLVVNCSSFVAAPSSKTSSFKARLYGNYSVTRKQIVITQSERFYYIILSVYPNDGLPLLSMKVEPNFHVENETTCIEYALLISLHRSRDSQMNRAYSFDICLWRWCDDFEIPSTALLALKHSYFSHSFRNSLTSLSS